METKLKIKDANVLIVASETITNWLKHDYGYYINTDLNDYDLKFNLVDVSYDYNQLPELTAKLYHDDYIVYESNNLRIIDFFKQGLVIYNILEKEINIYAQDIDYLYEIFYLSFESLLGETLDDYGWHRLHCLALANNSLATVLLLPPGSGKTTLALKFSNHNTIKILAEDMVLYKKGYFFGLHFRWGTRDQSFYNQGRLMKRQKYQDKILLASQKFNLIDQSRPKNIILGQRISSLNSQIIKINKLKLILPLFKSMVLGLELQQSLAYFLLRNYKDVFLKSKTGAGRLWALVNILLSSQTHIFYMGYDIDKNFKILNEFVLKDNN